MSENNNIEKSWACVKNGKVELVIIWDGLEDWPPSVTYEMVELPERSAVGPNWDYIEGEFVDNRPQPTDTE